ncbi:MAG: hypothetical protein EA344_08765 [Alkalicoccus sp.]|nr:MAG: hypothetical protein EA344_08765 [Alkalicoccus sp.]
MSLLKLRADRRVPAALCTCRKGSWRSPPRQSGSEVSCGQHKTLTQLFIKGIFYGKYPGSCG